MPRNRPEVYRVIYIENPLIAELMREESCVPGENPLDQYRPWENYVPGENPLYQY